jgi:hypothetical protein
MSTCLTGTMIFFTIPLLFSFVCSGDVNCAGIPGWGCVNSDQVEWYRHTSSSLQRLYGGPKPSLAFFHIPVPEFMVCSLVQVVVVV